jgi:hypothetical protein
MKQLRKMNIGKQSIKKSRITILTKQFMRENETIERN